MRSYHELLERSDRAPVPFTFIGLFGMTPIVTFVVSKPLISHHTSQFADLVFFFPQELTFFTQKEILQ